MNAKTIWDKIKSIAPNKKVDDDNDDRSTFSKHFEKLFLFIAVILLISLIYSLATYDYSNTLPDWILSTIQTPWFWLVLTGIILLIIFRKKITMPSWTPSSTTTKKVIVPKWIRSVLTFAIIVTILWFVVPRIHINWFSSASDNATAAVTHDRPVQVINSSRNSYSTLNTSGKKNKMNKDETYIVEFPISQSKKDYHLVFSIPKGDTSTVILTYQHGGDTWRRKIWRDALDRPQSQLLDIRPAPFPGACEVKSDKDCHVVVELEEVKK